MENNQSSAFSKDVCLPHNEELPLSCDDSSVQGIWGGPFMYNLVCSVSHHEKWKNFTSASLPSPAVKMPLCVFCPVFGTFHSPVVLNKRQLCHWALLALFADLFTCLRVCYTWESEPGYSGAPKTEVDMTANPRQLKPKMLVAPSRVGRPHWCLSTSGFTAHHCPCRQTANCQSPACPCLQSDFLLTVRWMMASLNTWHHFFQTFCFSEE